jgi:hypothetical protein
LSNIMLKSLKVVILKAKVLDATPKTTDYASNQSIALLITVTPTGCV